MAAPLPRSYNLMMKMLLAAVLSLCCGQAWAAQPGSLGAGIVLGSPTAATIKYFVTDTYALDAGIGGIGSDFSAYGDALWHAWDVFPQPEGARLGGYIGVGARVRNAREDTLIGI